MMKTIAILIALGTTLTSLSLRGADTSDLAIGWATPPDSAAPHTWWDWMNGNVTREGITADLEAMQRVGIRSATIVVIGGNIDVPPGPAKYLSPLWLDLVKFATSEAARLGLKIGFGNCAGWSSSGGPWITPENSMQMIVSSETTAQGPIHLSTPLPTPETRNGFYREIRVIAFPTPPDDSKRLPDIRRKSDDDPRIGDAVTGTPAPADSNAIALAQMVDLSSHLDDKGVLTWDVPAGKWTIVRFGGTTTGSINRGYPPSGGLGLECDKLDRHAAQVFWEGGPAKIIEAVGPLAGSVFNHVLIDSYEVGMQNWSPVLPSEFQRRRGYDFLPYLPVLTGRAVGSVEQSERFLWDFRRTIADLYTDNYFSTMTDLAHQAKLSIEVEPYEGGPLDDLMSARQADRIMGEFWWENPKVAEPDMTYVRIAASAAHTYGEPVVGAEAFTSMVGGWDMSPANMKALGDAAFASGINLFTFHRYAMQPWLNRWPGMTMLFFGSNLDRTNTWWEQGRAWMQYLARSQYLLQQGHSVADVLVCNDEGAPASMPAKPGLPDGYAFDACSPDVLLRLATVRDGRIFLPDGMNYRVLILPGGDTMTPALIRKVKQFADEGATVIGRPPARSPSLSDYPRCDEATSQLANELWASKKITEKPVAEALSGSGMAPDFEALGQAGSLVYLHRAAGAADIYFVSNQSHQRQEVDSFFRVSGKVPELWHADTAKIETTVLYVEEKGRTRVHLHLDPDDSVFVVFRDKIPDVPHPVSVATEQKPVAGESMQTLQIVNASYGVLPEGPSEDVTALLAARIKDGAIWVEANNELVKKGLAGGQKKDLRVDYVLNGKTLSETCHENEHFIIPPRSLPLPDYQLKSSGQKDLSLEVSRAGTYDLRMSDGSRKSIVLASMSAAQTVTGPWEIDFPPGWGAPPSIMLDKLASWSEQADPGVKYFSGTATYRTKLRIDPELVGEGHHLYLDLGNVQIIAELKLNGRNLGVLWKPPYRVEVTGVVQPGDNTLEIALTNQWPNRIIGDEQLPEDSERRSDNWIVTWPQWLLDGKPSPTGRFTFTTARHWKKSDPLFPSGLLGPVVLLPTRDLPVP